jgi:hypothetical protein
MINFGVLISRTEWGVFLSFVPSIMLTFIVRYFATSVLAA